MASKPRAHGASSARRGGRARFSSDDAKEAILRAAEKRLLEVGPQGLRLQEIARDVGLSHPTVLHHVGSRDALVEAVAARAMRGLEGELLACFEGLSPDADARQVTRATLDRVDEALRRRGHARILAWLALTKMTRPHASLLRDLARVIDAAKRARGSDAGLEDTQFEVLLAGAAMFGIAIVGPELLGMLGLADGEGMHRRFRAWFAEVLAARSGVPEG